MGSNIAYGRNLASSDSVEYLLKDTERYITKTFAAIRKENRSSVPDSPQTTRMASIKIRSNRLYFLNADNTVHSKKYFYFFVKENQSGRYLASLIVNFIHFCNLLQC